MSLETDSEEPTSVVRSPPSLGKGLGQKPEASGRSRLLPDSAAHQRMRIGVRRVAGYEGIIVMISTRLLKFCLGFACALILTRHTRIRCSLLISQPQQMVAQSRGKFVGSPWQ